MNSRSGNSFLEWLTILACVAVLAAIGVLTYGGRADAAKQAQAGLEVKDLAAAELLAAKLFGAFVPLQTLDDFPSGGSSELRDSAGNEPEALRVISAESAPADQVGKQAAFRSKAAEWKSSIYEAKRIYIPVGAGQGAGLEKTLSDPAAVRRDYPLDPWGQPYRFYSPIGIVGTTANDGATLDSDTFSDGALTTNDDRFDAWAIVSFGPDGKSDSVSSGNDDKIYLFEAGAAAQKPGA